MYMTTKRDAEAKTFRIHTLSDKEIFTKMHLTFKSIKQITNGLPQGTELELIQLHQDINHIDNALMQKILAMRHELHQITHTEMNSDKKSRISKHEITKNLVAKKLKLERNIDENVIKIRLLREARQIINANFESVLNKPYCMCH